MTPDDIQRWREACDRATIGPWEWRHGNPRVSADLCVLPPVDEPRVMLRVAEVHRMREADAAFIALAREAMPALLDTLEKLTQEHDHLREQYSDLLWRSATSLKLEEAYLAWVACGHDHSHVTNGEDCETCRELAERGARLWEALEDAGKRSLAARERGL